MMQNDVSTSPAPCIPYKKSSMLTFLIPWVLFAVTFLTLILLVVWYIVSGRRRQRCCTCCTGSSQTREPKANNKVQRQHDPRYVHNGENVPKIEDYYTTRLGNEQGERFTERSVYYNEHPDTSTEELQDVNIPKSQKSSTRKHDGSKTQHGATTTEAQIHGDDDMDYEDTGTIRKGNTDISGSVQTRTRSAKSDYVNMVDLPRRGKCEPVETQQTQDAPGKAERSVSFDQIVKKFDKATGAEDTGNHKRTNTSESSAGAQPSPSLTMYINMSKSTEDLYEN